MATVQVLERHRSRHLTYLIRTAKTGLRGRNAHYDCLSIAAVAGIAKAQNAGSRKRGPAPAMRRAPQDWELELYAEDRPPVLEQNVIALM
jgi:hypothetical protein